jgi:diguanylate cyclase (GGDEF)-like protein
MLLSPHPNALRSGTRVRWIALLAFGLTFAFGRPTLALDPQQAISQYVRAQWQDQLPHNTILSILQTRDGFLWFGTYEGLARFDGVEFTVFDRQNSALTSAAISSLAEDAGGDLWVGSGSGLYRFDRKTMKRVDLGPLGQVITALAESTDGNVWVATTRGLGRIESGKLRILRQSDGAPPQVVRTIRAGPHGDVWLGTEGGGLVAWHEGQFTTYTVDEGLSSNEVFAIATDGAGRVWVGTHGGGVDLLAEGRIAPALPSDSAISGNSIDALLSDHDGNVWMAVEGSGVCRLTGGEVSCEPAGAVPSDLIRSLFEDREGSVWIGGTNSGLRQLRDGKFTTTTGEHSTNYVRSVAESVDGTMWVGTDGSGTNVVRDAALVPFPADSRLPSEFVRSVYPDRDGNVWVGTLGGLTRLREATSRTYTKRNGLASDIVYAIHEGRDGSIWVGTSLGLNRLRKTKIEKTPVDGEVRAIHEDRNGRLWAGKRAGLSCLDQGVLTDCTAGTLFVGRTIFSFYEDEQGSVWIGSNQGLTRFRDGRFTTWSTRDGLLDDNVFEILEGDDGSLWTSSNKGVFRMPKADFDAYDAHHIAAIRTTQFGKADGMGATQCNGATQPAGWKSRDGRLWFPTVRGLVSIDPLRIRTNKVVPPVVVENVMVNSRPVDPRAPHAIRPGAQRMEIHYAALTFAAPERVRFRYKLEGYDQNWTEAGARRVAYYTNVPAGDYEFHVTACNNDGVWNESGAMLPFAVEPHFSETWWFRAAAILGIAALLAFAYVLRVSRLRQRERELVLLVDERTAELRLANEELNRLATSDGLTRIPNRRAFDDRLQSMWDEHRRRQSPLAVILCDIDHFKLYNDAYGHQAGDETLAAVAQAIDRAIRRPSDFAARYGGEEFVVLLGDTALENAAMVAEQVLCAVRALQIPHSESSPAQIVTLSLGVAAVVPSRKSQPEELLLAADEALYAAKAAGRNRVQLSPQNGDAARTASMSS